MINPDELTRRKVVLAARILNRLQRASFSVTWGVRSYLKGRVRG